MSSKNPAGEERKNKLIEFAKNDENFIVPVIADPQTCTQPERKSQHELEKQKRQKEQKQKRQRRKNAKKMICSCVEGGHINMKELIETSAQYADAI